MEQHLTPFRPFTQIRCRQIMRIVKFDDATKRKESAKYDNFAFFSKTIW